MSGGANKVLRLNPSSKWSGLNFTFIANARSAGQIVNFTDISLMFVYVGVVGIQKSRHWAHNKVMYLNFINNDLCYWCLTSQDGDKMVGSTMCTWKLSVSIIYLMMTTTRSKSGHDVSIQFRQRILHSWQIMFVQQKKTRTCSDRLQWVVTAVNRTRNRIDQTR